MSSDVCSSAPSWQITCGGGSGASECCNAAPAQIFAADRVVNVYTHLTGFCLLPLPCCYFSRNLASNYWAWRHGLPDLFLWRKDVAVTSGAAAVESPPCLAFEENSPRVKSPDFTPAVVVVKGGPSCEAVVEAVVGGKIANGGTFVPKREGRCMWVEVKGPGDSLSCAQEGWMDTLVGAGAEAVLLRVEDTASPR